MYIHNTQCTHIYTFVANNQLTFFVNKPANRIPCQSLRTNDKTKIRESHYDLQ